MKLNKKMNAIIIFTLLFSVELYLVSLLKPSEQKPVIHDKNTYSKTEAISKIEVISPKKLKRIDIKYLSFDGKEKVSQINVIDVIADDVLEVFGELKKKRFPMYKFYCYAPRTTRNREKISLHAYAAAIDINALMNPSYDAINNIMIPRRDKERQKDRERIVRELKKIGISEKEIKEILKITIQPKGFDDRFLNRQIIRKGMITQDIVDIFKKHGFNIWGGYWRQSIDYMHFQIPRQLAEQLAKSDFESRKKIWAQHKKNTCQP